MVSIPIEITGLAKNPYITDFECDPYTHIHSVKVWTLTDNIPKQLEISAALSDPNHKILVKDLEEFLPEHLHMHKDMHKLWWDCVFAIAKNNNLFWITREHPLEWEEMDDNEMKNMMGDLKLEEEANKSKKPKQAQIIPYKKVSGKVLMSTKEKGADKESVMEYLAQQKKSNAGKGKKKKKEEKIDDEE